MSKQFGGKVTPALKQRYSKSPQWKNDRFMNIEETKMELNFHTLPKLLYKQFFETEGREPKDALPIQSFDNERFTSSTEPQFIWYGHSVLLMRLNGLNILIDPMLGPNAAPISPVPNKRFSKNSLDVIDQLPAIDLILLTHDHYDHLDMASINKLKAKTKQYWVALGAERHLEKWGVNPNSVREFDWWDSKELEGIQITFTPTRHFSGRGLRDNSKSLWGGWVFITEQHRIYFSGDGGYGDHFKEVGKRLGPFDIAFMECGQYNENWHQIHMYPEESVKAANDVGAERTVAVHWAGFSLAQHTWKEPIERYTAEALKQNLLVLTPRIGEQFNHLDFKGERWWEAYT